MQLAQLPKRATVCLYLLLIAAFSAFGADKTSSKKPAASVTKLIIQMEHEWSQAGIRKDTKTMDRIIADDWISVDFQGKTVSKAQAIAELKSTASQTQPIELGDMKVRVLGTTAIVTGKDSTGKYAWMDVFMKRNGRWQAVASQSTKVEK